MRDTYPDGSYPQVIDELTYNIRRKLFQGSVEKHRHHSSQQQPDRGLTASWRRSCTGVGGTGLHWSGVHFRVDPIELRMRSHYEERYGKNFIPKDMTIGLWRNLRRAGTVLRQSGESVRHLRHRPDHQRGRKWRRRAATALRRIAQRLPPAQKNTYSAQLFEKAALEVGYHPYNLPSANTSDSYTNPYGAQMGPYNFTVSAAATLLHVFQSFAERQHSAGAAHGKTLRATHQRQRAGRST